jgi:protoporphyrin/coproporphyrin ferrochelatase
MKIGVLLVNLGTPDSPQTGDVRKYLRQFLMDGRVIDIPYLFRWLLVNLIIAPFRAPKSAKIYKELWTERGSPLLFHGLDLQKLLQGSLGNDYIVEFGMRYQKPSIEAALNRLKTKHLQHIIIVPLFPQYASASTGSVKQEVMRLLSKWQLIPKITMIDSYAENAKMVKTYAEIGKRYIAKEKFDHFVFTYHGLPERQIRKGDCTGKCLSATCCNQLENWNRLCYRGQCFATSRLLAKELGLTEADYTVAFQSRLGSDPWIKPYTDEKIKELVQVGKKRILAFSPSFVADCLETTIEIGEEYKELFEQAGGEHWQLVESLNTEPLWVATLADMVKTEGKV